MFCDSSSSNSSFQKLIYFQLPPLVAAVGIKCRRWITQHGLAVNVEESSLSNFEGIVPCGLEGRKVGCLNQFLTKQGDEPITVRDFAIHMKEALEEVFRIELVDKPLLV